MSCLQRQLECLEIAIKMWKVIQPPDPYSYGMNHLMGVAIIICQAGTKYVSPGSISFDESQFDLSTYFWVEPMFCFQTFPCLHGTLAMQD